MKLRNTLLSVAVCALLGIMQPALAETLSANGQAQVSVAASDGNIVTARRIARENAEKDAVASLLRLKLNVNANDPKTAAAIGDLVKQLSANLRTTFQTEDDMLTARTTLEADSSQVFDLARSLGITSTTAMAQAKVVFMIDEYYGVATHIQPGQPLTNEIEYSHDKSSLIDKTSTAAASSDESAHSSSSSQSSVSVAAKRRAGAYGNSSRSYSDGDVSKSREGNFAAASKASFKGSASSSDAKQSAYSSNASYSAEAKDINQQNDKVTFKIKQTFPDVNNAKPADGAAALIPARLEQVIKPYGLVYTPERDLRVSLGAGKVRIVDIEKNGKYGELTRRAAGSPYNAKYVVYGESVMSSEGKTPSGDASCNGSLKLQSYNVDSGDGLVSGTINKRAQGSSDQDCRANLATAMATELAQVIGNSASRELQLAATQGQSFYVTLYSAMRIPARVRREISGKLQSMVEQFTEDNVTENTRTYVVQAKGNFRSKVEDMIDDSAAQIAEMKSAVMKVNGNRMVICIEGYCPKEF